MACQAGRYKTFIPLGIFIVTPSLEGSPTKAKEEPSPHELRLVLLDINPVFQCLEEKNIFIGAQKSIKNEEKKKIFASNISQVKNELPCVLLKLTSYTAKKK